jgi:hypothetical protein
VEGEIRRATNEDAEAERCYRRALEVAERQEARWWQLRATVGLAGLYAERRKRAAARAVLAPIVDAFTEGLDTRDVADARALLATLR